ncbi:hypothetical protein Ac2012v2_003490 [Leucoagaricus gongylophorus]
MSIDFVSYEKSIAELQTSRQQSCQLDVLRTSMFVLTQKDRPIPSLQQMKYDIEKDDLTLIKERIATARVNHKANIERIYVAHAEDYLNDQRLRRESREDYVTAQNYGISGKLAEWSEKRDPLSSIDHHYEMDLQHSVAKECFRHASVISNLYMKRRDTEIEVEKVRQKQDATFPLTLEEFRSKPRAIQIRVANYLSFDAAKRERMMTEFGWAYRQVIPLVREFEMNEEFQDEIIKLLGTIGSKDPRRK